MNFVKVLQKIPFVFAVIIGCSGSGSTLARPETAEKWYQRAQGDFRNANLNEAAESATKALSFVPNDTDVRMLAARIALARLEYDETLRLLSGLQGSEARALRGRALWYKGNLEQAADELESLLTDPEVTDEWAKSVAKLARRGIGRTPFQISGGIVTQVEMPHLGPNNPYLVIPIEIDGESALAAIFTGNAEVVMDSASRQEPSWVSLRMGGRIEIRDVPALTQDLSGISKQLGAPIKALIGVNILRRMNATIDYAGRQFVVRTTTPPPPPNATRVDIFYIRGGGMVMRGTLGSTDTNASLLVDTSSAFPIALDQAAWKKIGMDATNLPAIVDDPTKKIREGSIPMLRVGAFDIPNVPGIYGAPIDQIEKLLAMDIDGVLGAGFISKFRVTFGDGGRFIWLEGDSNNTQPTSKPTASASTASTPPPQNTR